MKAVTSFPTLFVIRCRSATKRAQDRGWSVGVYAKSRDLRQIGNFTWGGTQVERTPYLAPSHVKDATIFSSREEAHAVVSESKTGFKKTTGVVFEILELKCQTLWPVFIKKANT